MCFRPNGATASRRRRSARGQQAPTLPPLAMLDLSKPGERQAHDFLLRATNGRDRMWQLLDMRKLGDVLLCLVRWVRSNSLASTFSLAEVSLAETAVYWQSYGSVGAARAEMERRCTAATAQDGVAANGRRL